jgi:hypothetical protein
MPTTTAGLRIQTAALAAAGTHVGHGTGGQPQTTTQAATFGAETTATGYARRPVTWDTTDPDADWTAAPVDLNAPATATNTPYTWWGLWTADRDGTLLAWGRLLKRDGNGAVVVDGNGVPVEAPEAFGNAGVLRVTPSTATSST